MEMLDQTARENRRQFQSDSMGMDWVDKKGIGPQCIGNPRAVKSL